MTGAAADGLQQVVDGLANRLGRSVAVDDAHGRVVTVSRHFGDEDPLRVYAVLQRDSDPRVMAHFRAHGIYGWTSPGRVPAQPGIDFKARVCCPARAHGLLFGHLFLIDDGVEDREIELAAAAAAEVGLLMYRRVVLHEQERARREELVRDLLSDDATTRDRARRAAAEELRVSADGAVVTVVVDATDPGPGSGPAASESTDPTAAADAATALRTAVERATRDDLATRSLSAVHGRRAVLLLFDGAATAETGRTLAVRTITEFDRTGARARVVAGIGAVHRGPAAPALGHHDARIAVHAATLLPRLGDVLDEQSLGVYDLLLRLPRSEIDESRLPEGLRSLIGQDPGGTLVDTLEAYLDHGGDATRTAGHLRLHRSTLYYRLGRIETVTGARLRDGASRLAMHVGVKLHRMLEAYRERPGLRVSD